MKTEIVFLPDPSISGIKSEELELCDFNERITANRLLRLMYVRGWSNTAWRQWLCEVKYNKNGKEKVAIGFDMGGGEIAISEDTLIFEHRGGFTWIKRQQDVLAVVMNIDSLLCIESQDLLQLPKADYLVLHGAHDEQDAKELFRKLSGKYRVIKLFTPADNSLSALAMKCLQPKADGSIENCTYYFSYWGSIYLSSLWHYLISNKRKRPQWASCLRCCLYPKCKPQRCSWSFVCKKYSPIGTAGMMRHPVSEETNNKGNNNIKFNSMEKFLEHYTNVLSFPTLNARIEGNLLIAEDEERNELVAFIDKRSKKSFRSRLFAYSKEFIANVEACKATKVLVVNEYNTKNVLCWDVVEGLKRATRVFDEFGEEIVIINLKRSKHDAREYQDTAY